MQSETIATTTGGFQRFTAALRTTHNIQEHYYAN
jgi:hypothetical protein